jgi:hypothetical protein
MLVDGATHNKKKEFHEQKENEERTEKYRGSGEEIEGMRKGDRGRTRRRRAEKSAEKRNPSARDTEFSSRRAMQRSRRPAFFGAALRFPPQNRGRQA